MFSFNDEANFCDKFIFFMYLFLINDAKELINIFESKIFISFAFTMIDFLKVILSHFI